jgi:hypothetical protein
LSGALEIKQTGELESFVKISQTGELLGHEGDWDPDLFGPYAGLEVYLPSAAFSPAGELFWVYGGGPAYRFDPETLQVNEQFMFTGGPNTNYTSGAFDPLTGHWFVGTTSNTLLEIDPANYSVLSETDLSAFVPPPNPSFGRYTVNAIEFDLSGEQLILGGLFGLTVVQRAVPEPIPGDFNKDGVLSAADIDDLTGQSAGGMNPDVHDLNADALVNIADVNIWVKDLFHSWIGDANLDHQFNSSDLVVVLGAGRYEADVAANWSTGDFDGSGRFDSTDLIFALADGGFELGPRAANAAVPEPSGGSLLLLGLLASIRQRRRQAIEKFRMHE